MTSKITAKACEAWWVLEAADLRGLPAPFVVRVTDHSGIELGVKTVAQFDRWAESLAAEPVVSDFAGIGQRTVTGQLHDIAVTVFVSEISAVRS